ncbi:hypothetical protein FF011L_04060 [Roseimaritima multifibrata]|uniref:Uncharacterized protein n=1 Tax=Roseimaritima multifibrata TaxID=1930274 RepID=A0A517M9Y0_9BACT|nr:hypothetical protein [Roseimaritima multifibrata]QDS91674.1 hypothetical protein FF011L_04060 [Roseimaritima multifibrata]
MNAVQVNRYNDLLVNTASIDNPSIFLTTWSSLIRDARYRYEFFKKELAIELSDDDGLQYLRENHGELFADDWSVPKKTQRRKKAKKTL